MAVFDIVSAYGDERNSIVLTFVNGQWSVYVVGGTLFLKNITTTLDNLLIVAAGITSYVAIKSLDETDIVVFYTANMELHRAVIGVSTIPPMLASNVVIDTNINGLDAVTTGSYLRVVTVNGTNKITIRDYNDQDDVTPYRNYEFNLTMSGIYKYHIINSDNPDEIIIYSVDSVNTASVYEETFSILPNTISITPPAGLKTTIFTADLSGVSLNYSSINVSSSQGTVNSVSIDEQAQTVSFRILTKLEGEKTITVTDGVDSFNSPVYIDVPEVNIPITPPSGHRETVFTANVVAAELVPSEFYVRGGESDVIYVLGTTTALVDGESIVNTVDFIIKSLITETKTIYFGDSDDEYHSGIVYYEFVPFIDIEPDFGTKITVFSADLTYTLLNQADIRVTTPSDQGEVRNVVIDGNTVTFTYYSTTSGQKDIVFSDTDDAYVRPITFFLEDAIQPNNGTQCDTYVIDLERYEPVDYANVGLSVSDGIIGDIVTSIENKNASFRYYSGVTGSKTITITNLGKLSYEKFNYSAYTNSLKVTPDKGTDENTFLVDLSGCCFDYDSLVVTTFDGEFVNSSLDNDLFVFTYKCPVVGLKSVTFTDQYKTVIAKFLFTRKKTKLGKFEVPAELPEAASGRGPGVAIPKIYDESTFHFNR